MNNSDAAGLRKRAEEKAARSPEADGNLPPEAARLALHELRVHQIELEMQNEELCRAQAELGASQALYFDLYDLAPVGYVTVAENGLILDANLTLATLLGVARGELVSRRFSRFIPKEETDRYYLFRKTLFATGEPQACELKMLKDDGTPFWAQLTATAAQGAEGKRVSRIALSDITERKHAESMLRMALQAAGAGTWDWDMTTDSLFWSAEMFRLFGLDPATATASFETWRNILHPDDRSDAEEHIRAAIRDHIRLTNSCRIVLPTGEVRWIHAVGDTIADTSPKSQRMLGICIDVTERMQTETYRDMSLQILQILNGSDGLRESIGHALAFMKTQTGADAVGLRLQDGEDFPYFAQQGFSEAFLLKENALAERGPDGGVCRDKDGKVCLECTCGLVLSGMTDPTNPLFTRGGSFWTGDSAPLLGLPPGQDPRYHPRNECILQGYASVALIPVRDKERIVGLLHLNGRRKGCFSLATIKILEDLAAHIGEALTRKRVEESLRETQAVLQAAMDQSPAGIAIADAPGGKLRYVNDAGLLIRGGTRESVVNGIGIDQYVSSWQLTDLDGRLLKSDEVPLARAILFGETCSREFVIRKAAGDDRIVLGNAAPIKDGDGRVVAGIVVFTDITERKRTEKALEKNEREFRSLAESMPQIVWITRADGWNIYFNQQWVEYTGLTLEESYGHGWNTPFHPDDRQRAWDAWKNATENDATYSLEVRLRRADGTYRWWLVRGVPLRDADGQIIKWFGTCTDIEDIKLAEEALRNSEERFHRAVTDAPFPILLHAEDGEILLASNTWCEITGYTHEELATIGDWTARAYGERKQEVQADIDALYSLGHRKYEGDYTIRTKSGARRIWEFSSAPLGALRDGRRLVISMAIDVTERRQGEHALQANQQRLDLALRSAHMGVWQWDIASDRRTFDDQTCSLLGLAPATFGGTASEFFAAIHPDDRDQVKKALTRALAGDAPYNPEYRVVWPDGTVRHIGASGRLVRDSAGHPASIIGTIWDITEHRRVEEELQKMDKLQSVGTLAGGIAHDFNNVLLGLFGNISIAMEDLAKDHPSYAPLEEAEKSMTRAVRLTKQLLTFAKGGTPVKENVSLVDMVEEVAHFDLTGSNVSLVYHHDEDLWPVDADRGQIQQVVSNLVINARQAMPKGGKLTITLENADLSESSVLTLSAGRYVKISVQDDGDGINPKVIDHIFDPYFTTKQSGNGLGLTTVWSIINKHGGHIGVVSQMGKGTTFTFYLPASASPLPEETKAPAAECPAPARTAKILVMDDEASVNRLVVQMLKTCGYTVATAPNAREAIALYRQALETEAPYDAVIMDLTIPGGPGGKEVIQDLLSLDPSVRAIVSSGYAEDPIMANPTAYGFKGTLAKPYTAKALREAVARVLA